MKDVQSPCIFCVSKSLLPRAVPTLHPSLLMSCCGAGSFIMRDLGYPTPRVLPSPPLFPSTCAKQCAMPVPCSHRRACRATKPPSSLVPHPAPPWFPSQSSPPHPSSIRSLLWQKLFICLTNVTLRPHSAKSYADFYTYHFALSSAVCAPCAYHFACFLVCNPSFLQGSTVERRLEPLLLLFSPCQLLMFPRLQ